MQYKKKYTFQRINYDLAPDKRDSRTHLNLVNMEVFLTSRGASAIAAKGTSSSLSITAGHFIIGHGDIVSKYFIFTTDNDSTPNESSTDRIYQVEDNETNVELSLIEEGNWGFSTQNPIQAIGISEEAGVSEKLYWIDGYNQMRFINVILPTQQINFSLSNNDTAVITAGKAWGVATLKASVRYGFTQYNLRGSESKMSHLTDSINISDEGNATVEVNITGLNTIYDNYRIYRVMWESYNAAPSYAIVQEGPVPSTGSISLQDSGSLFVKSLSVDEFLTIGSDLVIPKGIASKKKRLFPTNYKVSPFNITEDTRAFSFKDAAAQATDAGWEATSTIPESESIIFQPFDGSAQQNLLTGQIVRDGVPEEIPNWEYATYYTDESWDGSSFPASLKVVSIPYSEFTLRQDSYSSTGVRIRIYPIAKDPNASSDYTAELLGTIDLAIGDSDVTITQSGAYAGQPNGFKIALQYLNGIAPKFYPSTISVIWFAELAGKQKLIVTVPHAGIPDIEGQPTTADGTITFTNNPADGGTVVIGNSPTLSTFTFKNTPAAPYDVQIDANYLITAENLEKAINGDGDASNYYPGTYASYYVTAEIVAGVVTVTALIEGYPGNAYILTKTATNVTVSGAGTLTGGLEGYNWTYTKGDPGDLAAVTSILAESNPAGTNTTVELTRVKTDGSISTIWSSPLTPNDVDVSSSTETIFTFNFAAPLYLKSSGSTSKSSTAGTPVEVGDLVWLRITGFLAGTRTRFTSDDGSGSTSVGVLELQEETDGPIKPFGGFEGIDPLHNAINPDPWVFRYQSDGSTLGAEGPMVKLELELITNTSTYNALANRRVFKSGEIYRIGIKFKDTYERETPAYWVTDLLIPYATSGTESTGRRHFYRLSGSIKRMPDGAKSFKFLYVKRELKDKTVLFQGVVQPVMKYEKNSIHVGYYPFPNMKEVKGGGANTWFDARYDYLVGNDWMAGSYSEGLLADPTATGRSNDMNLVYTPETILYKTDLPGSAVRMVGVQKVYATADSTRFEFNDPDTTTPIVLNANYSDIRFNQFTVFAGESQVGLFDDFGTAVDGEFYSSFFYYRQGGAFFNCKPNAGDIKMSEHTLVDCKYLGFDSNALIGSAIISNTINEPQFSGAAAAKCNFEMQFLDCFVIDVDIASWATTTLNYDKFVSELEDTAGFGTANTDRGFPIVDVLQTVIDQYGGNTVEARSTNIYIDASEGSTSIDTNVILFGDTYIGIYRMPRGTSSRSVTNNLDTSVFDFVTVSLESEVSVELANTLLKEWNGDFDSQIASTIKALEVQNIVSYDKVFSQFPTDSLSLSKPFNYIDQSRYDTRVSVSDIKVTGEIIDSWTKINLGTYLDLESQYGPITRLVRIKDAMIAFQPRAIALLSIYPDKQISTGDGQIKLGKGGVLDNYQYIDIESGCSNWQSIAVVEDDVYFIDDINKTLNSVSEGKVSRIKGFNTITELHMRDKVKDFLTTDNADGGFVFVNPKFKQVLFRFCEQGSFGCLAYNYVTKEFVSTRIYRGYHFMTFGDDVYSIKDNEIHKHDSQVLKDSGSPPLYYGDPESGQIHMFIEPLPGVDKVFDAITVLGRGNGITNAIIEGAPDGNVTNKTSGYVALSWANKYNIRTAHLPRIEGTIDRFRCRNLIMYLFAFSKNEVEIDSITVKFSAKK
jgi:hypothetical protein